VGDGPSAAAALRADMDALPIQEATRQALGQPGAGQDARLRPRWPHRHAADARPGIWRPRAASTAPCTWCSSRPRKAWAAHAHDGRRLFRAVSMRRDVRAAQHARPRPGPARLHRAARPWRSCDTVIVTLQGQGGHGAVPHRGVDPVVAGAGHRDGAADASCRAMCDPLEMAIVPVGPSAPGDAPNVIPDERRTASSRVRAFKPEVRDLLQQRIREIAQAQAAVLRRHAPTVRLPAPLPGAGATTPTETGLVPARWRGLAGRRRADRRRRPLTGQRGLRLLPRAPGCYFCHRQRHGRGRRLHGAQPRLRLQRRLSPTRCQLWVRLAQDYLSVGG